MTLSKEIIFTQLESTNPFPIDFDAAWKWLGFSRKNNAKASLLDCGFASGVDLLIEKQSDNHEGLSAQEKAVAARREQIHLTTDCFKMWCMMANTDRGKEVRRFYLEVEKEWRQLKSQAPKPIALPPADIRICNLRDALKDFGFDLSNPRFASSIKDLVADRILGEVGQPKETTTNSTETWLGVVEKAERMGYPVKLITRYRSTLGKHVKANSNLKSKLEKRLCNGTQRSVCLYRDCEELARTVAEYMDAKASAAQIDVKVSAYIPKVG